MFYLDEKKYILLLLLLATISCGPKAVGPGPAIAPSVSETEFVSADEAALEARIGLAELSPYFRDVLGGEAATALAEDRLVEALKMFDEIAGQVSDIELTPRARFIAAYLAELLGDAPRALKELPALAEELPTLADTARERAARAALKLGKCERAIDLAALVDDASTVAPDAALIRADALRLLSRYVQAVEAYREYLEKWPGGPSLAEARARIVECQARLIAEGLGDRAMAEEGLRRVSELRAQTPTSQWTERAAAREETFIKFLGRKTSPTRREPKKALTLYDKAAGLMRKMRNEEAEKMFNRVIRLARRRGRLSCKAHYDRAVVIARQRQQERAAEAFGDALDTCSAPEYRVRSLYRGAKAYQAAGVFREAIRLYGEVESEFSAHSYADDARLHAARCHRALGNRDQFVEMLQSLPESYPAGDMRAEALWTLAHDALKRNNLVEARDVLRRYYEMFPQESGWYAAGRSGYWLGRVEERLGDHEAGAMRYEQVVAGAPLTFYMVLAYNRLAAIDKQRAEQLIAKLAPRNVRGKTQFPRSLLEDFPRLAAGVELHRLGLVSLARREFDALLVEPNLPPDVYWLTAALLRKAGRFHEGREAAAKADKSWARRYPTGRDFVQWELAFPLAYEEEVNHAASQSGVEAALILSVMREESGFNPDVESWANAIGLMQLILPTARSMGRALGIRANRRTLRRPEVNIQLGSAYLAYLAKMFENHPVLVAAGYNAGEGAVGKWAKARPGDDIDIFVEEIPYDQTRGYTKRVIGTLATYLFLYSDQRSILTFDMSVP